MAAVRSLGAVGVEPVRHRGVEHLGARVVALAEVVGPLHRGDQVGRDRLAVGVLREGLQHAGVPGPLLEQLARRLDEVPLGGHAGEPAPVGAPREHVVHEVPELVEQRDDVVVLHQPLAEVAHQHALGQLGAGDAVGDRELRRVRVLALARVEVEVDAAQGLAGERHVVRRHVGVPDHRVVDGGVGEVEQPAGHVEQAGAHTAVKSKYVRTTWASTSYCSLRTSSS